MCLSKEQIQSNQQNRGISNKANTKPSLSSLLLLLNYTFDKKTWIVCFETQSIIPSQKIILVKMDVTQFFNTYFIFSDEKRLSDRRCCILKQLIKYYSGKGEINWFLTFKRRKGRNQTRPWSCELRVAERAMSQESFIYGFVARGTMVLAEYTEFTGNFPAIAAQCLEKLPSSNNKFTYNCDHHTFNFLVEDGYGIADLLLFLFCCIFPSLSAGSTLSHLIATNISFLFLGFSIGFP